MDAPAPAAGSASYAAETGRYSTPRFDCDCIGWRIKGHELKDFGWLSGYSEHELPRASPALSGNNASIVDAAIGTAARHVLGAVAREAPAPRLTPLRPPPFAPISVIAVLVSISQSASVRARISEAGRKLTELRIMGPSRAVAANHDWSQRCAMSVPPDMA